MDLAPYLQDLQWVIVIPETTKGNPYPMNMDCVRRVRDEAVTAQIPFFVKQINGKNGDHATRELDSRAWDEFSAGFVK